MVLFLASSLSCEVPEELKAALNFPKNPVLSAWLSDFGFGAEVAGLFWLDVDAELCLMESEAADPFFSGLDEVDAFWLAVGVVDPFWLAAGVVDPFWLAVGAADPFWLAAGAIETFWLAAGDTDSFWLAVVVIVFIWLDVGLADAFWLFTGAADPFWLVVPDEALRLGSVLSLLTFSFIFSSFLSLWSDPLKVVFRILRKPVSWLCSFLVDFFEWSLPLSPFCFLSLDLKLTCFAAFLSPAFLSAAFSFALWLCNCQRGLPFVFEVVASSNFSTELREKTKGKIKQLQLICHIFSWSSLPKQIYFSRQVIILKCSALQPAWWLGVGSETYITCERESRENRKAWLSDGTKLIMEAKGGLYFS